MKINQAGIDLIKSFEGLRLRPYKCPAGVWTIGYGHTNKVTEDTMGMTEKQAENVLKQDLEIFEKGVNKLLKVQVTENQFSALVSFAFNVGLQAFAGSSVLRYINTGFPIMAGQRLLLWNKAGGKVLAGLTRRREAEKKLYETK